MLNLLKSDAVTAVSNAVKTFTKVQDELTSAIAKCDAQHQTISDEITAKQASLNAVVEAKKQATTIQANIAALLK